MLIYSSCEIRKLCFIEKSSESEIFVKGSEGFLKTTPWVEQQILGWLKTFGESLKFSGANLILLGFSASATHIN